MSKENTLILTSLQVEQKLQRIARELLENNYNEEEIILIGIKNRGLKIASKLFSILKSISEKEIKLLHIEVHKENPLDYPIILSKSIEEISQKSVILIDDVLNSGKTLIYAAGYLINSDLKQLNTVVLVDRKHRRFPIRADFVGLTLSTTFKEHIWVKEIKENVFEVYLC